MYMGQRFPAIARCAPMGVGAFYLGQENGLTVQDIRPGADPMRLDPALVEERTRMAVQRAEAAGDVETAEAIMSSYETWKAEYDKQRLIRYGLIGAIGLGLLAMLSS
jgi:hypothetical protein